MEICKCNKNRSITVFGGIDYCQLCEKQIRVQPIISISVDDSLEDKDVIAHIQYPDEGNIITIKRGLNIIELSTAIHHEIGHLIDWYISDGMQSEDKKIREYNANVIGNCIRFRGSSK